jgi:quercetin dioxygenase-like cupin family protein
LGEDEEQTTETFYGKVVELKALVTYQDSSIVSRTLVDADAGTITLFAFDRNQGLSEHVAPYDAFVYVLDGEAEIIVSNKPSRLRAGEAIIIPANEPHALKAPMKFKMALAMIKR